MCNVAGGSVASSERTPGFTVRGVKPWTKSDLDRAKKFLGENLEVTKVAKKLGVSTSALRSAFQRAGLKSPGKYLRKVKVVGKLTIPDAPSRPLRVMVCPDAHHPYVDKRAWAAFLEAARRLKPDVLVIIGDFVDCYAVSSHVKSPARQRELQWEIEEGRKAVAEVATLGIPRVVFCEGNHETRLSRYIAEKAPELYGMIDVPTLLGVYDHGWEWVPYGTWIRIGEVSYMHDVGRCGANTARQSLQDFGDNLVIGHSHRGQVVYSGTVAGKVHVCMNVGCLVDFKSCDYMNQAKAMRDWTHGFGWCEQAADGVTWCNFIPIIEGRCVVNGMEIAA